MACTIEIVDDVKAAIDHIHQHGRHAGITWISSSFVSVLMTDSLTLFSTLPICCSAHTECIITEDSEAAETFLHQVDR
jgi:delta-1-pyrroline-5-carboxylate synthetase